jgi:ribosomal protein S24E
LGWWRIFECKNPDLTSFKVVDNIILYKQKRLNSIHTHIKNNNKLTHAFNDLIFKLVHKSSYKQYNFLYSHLDNTFQEGVILCFQYYNDNNKARQFEIDYCLQKNLDNNKISKVVSFSEYETSIPYIFENNTKFENIRIPGRLTYEHVFNYVNIHFKNRLVCICNADIFLDHHSDWKKMLHYINTNNRVIYALSRHEFDGNKIYKDREFVKLAYAQCQDAWFFVPEIKVDNVNIIIGTLGCDNAVAKEMNTAKYMLINSPNTYKIFHYDQCRKKNGTNFKQFSTLYEKNKGINNDNIEKHGSYLCPDIDQINSIDFVVDKMLFLNKNQKYKIICDILSEYIKIKN